MTTPLQPIITRQEADAFAASALDWLGWLLALICRLGAPRRSKSLIRLLELCERGVEAIVFLKAVAAFGVLRGPRRRALPLAAPAGFRRVRVNPRRRLFYKRARIRAQRAPLYARALRLIAVLANPAIFVARFIKRLRGRSLRGSFITLVAPPAWALALGAPQPPIVFDDS